MRMEALDQSKLAKNGDEYLKLLDSDADWFIRTPDDLRQIRDARDGVFSKIRDEDFREFADSLEFKRGGVVTGSYKPFMDPYYTLSDVFEVFERFGMGREYFSRVLEAKCVDGDWDFAFWRFCGQNCIEVVK